MPKRRPDVDEKRREITQQLSLAERGDAAAQNVLAARLAQGYFVKSDQAGALYWYAQAARQGYTYAKWNAGTMFLHGEGTPSAMLELGMLLVEQAAECGEVSARQFLSQCYARGMFGKPVDLGVSKGWADGLRGSPLFVEYGVPIDIATHGVSLTKPQIEWA
jgi:hypothetical protein